MTKKENDMKENIEETEIMDELEQEIEDLKNEEGEIDEELLDQPQGNSNSQINQLKNALAKSQADYENFKRRTARDKEEMVFFIKSKVINPILKRIDDLERIIKNTPKKDKKSAQFQAITALEKSLKRDLKDMGVSEFTSLGKEVDTNKHDVMTQVPGKKEGIICDEFEKGYMLDDKVLRVAKVVVGAGK